MMESENRDAARMTDREASKQLARLMGTIDAAIETLGTHPTAESLRTALARAEPAFEHLKRPIITAQSGGR